VVDNCYAGFAGLSHRSGFVSSHYIINNRARKAITYTSRREQHPDFENKSDTDARLFADTWLALGLISKVKTFIDGKI